MIQKWKFISRTKVLDHPRMRLVEDVVELPDGKQASYLRQAPAISHSAAVIAIDDQDRILIQREYSYPPDEVLYQLPGGAMEPNEKPEHAALRELAEESGFTAADCNTLGFVYANNRRSDQKQYVVVCRNISEHTLPKDPEEFIESMWLSRQEITDLIANGEVQNMNMLAALQLFDAVKTQP